MQISHPQAVFMTFLVRSLGARRAIEIGTFTGYSALAIARGLPPGGRLLACDVSDEWTAIARDAWTVAGVADRIDLRIGPALQTLAALSPREQFDFAFIDADKESYIDYYEALLPRMEAGGLMLADNTLWEGKVTDASRSMMRPPTPFAPSTHTWPGIPGRSRSCCRSPTELTLIRRRTDAA